MTTLTKNSPSSYSWLAIGFLGVFLISAPSALSQSKERIVQWSQTSTTIRNTISDHSEVLAQIEALEIRDVTVGGKSVIMGEPFAADDEWLKTLTIRVKNVSSLTISKVQINLFLPEIMPGGPLVTLCYGCGDVGQGQSIAAGQEVEMKLVFYNSLVDQINSKSSLALITRAEIENIIVTLPGRKPWLSGCIRTVNLKNACPQMRGQASEAQR